MNIATNENAYTRTRTHTYAGFLNIIFSQNLERI